MEKKAVTEECQEKQVDGSGKKQWKNVRTGRWKSVYGKRAMTKECQDRYRWLGMKGKKIVKEERMSGQITMVGNERKKK